MRARVDADGRRHQVVAQAAELFDRSGYHAINVESLAAAVGLSKATLYHYFSGKDEILFWIHEEFIDVLLEKIERIPADAPPEIRIERVMGDILDLMRTHRGHVRVFFEHHRELSDKSRAVILEKRDRYQTAVEAIIREGIEAGHLRDVDSRLTALAIFGMCNWAYQWFRVDGPLAPREIAEFFASILIKGLAPRSDGPHPGEAPIEHATAAIDEV